MQQNNKYIEFLNHLSNILAKKISPATTIFAVNKVFKEYLGIEKISFVIWDNNNMMLKDFVQDWKLYDDTNQEKEINFIYTQIAEKDGNIFFFNEQEFNCNVKDDAIIDIQANVDKRNNIQYPLISNNEIIG